MLRDGTRDPGREREEGWVGVRPVAGAQGSEVGALRGIVFDLDDTLYAERDYAFSGFDSVAGAFGDRLSAGFDLAARMRELFDTPDRQRVFNVISAQCNAPETIVAEMIEHFRHHAPRIQLHPDAEAALARLRPSRKLGVISDGYAAVQHAKIDALGVRDRVDAVIVTDDFGRAFWKPHPRAFEEMAARLGVEHTRCTYVGDNPAKDFVAPNALGWHTVFINRPDGVHVENPPADGGAAIETITSLDTL